jgi:putative aldouronate transport system permease protein
MEPAAKKQTFSQPPPQVPLHPVNNSKRTRRQKRKRWKQIKQNWELYLFLLPTLVYFIVFHYIPMYGVQIAFRDYSPGLGITGSPWVGLEHFIRLFV